MQKPFEVFNQIGHGGCGGEIADVLADLLKVQLEIAWNEARRTISWNYKYGVAPLADRSSSRVEVVRNVRKALDNVALSDGAPLA